MFSADRWFRLLSTIYPPSDDAELSGERLTFLRARFRRASESGTRRRFWLDLLGDTAIALPTAWGGHLWTETTSMLRITLNDLRLGARALLRRPALAATAIVTLGIGIGASTALFSVVNGVLLRPLPYPDSDRFVTLWNRTPENGVDKDWFAPAHLTFLRENVSSLENLTLFSGGEAASVLDADETVYIRYVQTTPGFMDLIGARAGMGRVLQPADAQAGADAVAVLTHEGWMQRFAGDPDVVGRSIRIGGLPLVIVGVLAEDVRVVPESVPTVGTIRGLDILINQREAPEFLSQTDLWNYNIVGHLAEGVTAAQAEAEIERLLPDFRSAFGIPESSFDITVTRVLDDIVAGMRGIIGALFAASGLVLLIACGNVAILLLAGGERRTMEFGVRRALGAGGGRLRSQLIGEQLLVAVPAALVGIGLAHVGLRVLVQNAPLGLPRVNEIGIDLGALAFSVGLCVAVTLLIGLFPALRAQRVQPNAALRGGGRGRVDRGGSLRARPSIGTGMSVFQIALTIVVLIGAGLMLRSYSTLLREDPGFSTSGVLTMRVGLGISPPPAAERWPAVSSMLERVEAIPGVQAAGISNLIPLGSSVAWGGIDVEGQEPESVVAELRAISPGYFEAMGIDVQAGRLFDSGEMAGQSSAAMVDQELVDRYWENEDGTGRLIGAFGNDSLRVVGVVGNVRQYRLDEPSSRTFLYVPYGVFPMSNFYLAARTEGEVAGVMGAVQQTVLDALPGSALRDIQPVEARMSTALASRRYGVALITLFASIAVFLAGTGTYALLAFRIAAAHREIGLRAALGANRARLAGTVCRFGASLGIGGLVFGLPAAFVAGRLIESQLYGVRPADPTTFLLAVVGTLLLALISAGVPALRAAATDPAEALREG